MAISTGRLDKICQRKQPLKLTVGVLFLVDNSFTDREREKTTYIIVNSIISHYTLVNLKQNQNTHVRVSSFFFFNFFQIIVHRVIRKMQYKNLYITRTQVTVFYVNHQYLLVLHITYCFPSPRTALINAYQYITKIISSKLIF